METRLRVSTLLFGAALLIAISCGGLKVPGASSTTASKPAEASSDPRGDLKKAFTAQLAAKSFRYSLEISIQEGGHIEAEFVAPDRYHVKGKSMMPGDGENHMEVIILGPDSFMKMGNMPWKKSEAGSATTIFASTMAQMAQQFRAMDSEQRMANYEDVKFVGRETLDGSPALVYQFILKGAQGQTNGKIWISANDGLPRKIEHEGGASPNPKGDTGKSRLTVTYYDYNTNIKIEPPI